MTTSNYLLQKVAKVDPFGDKSTHKATQDQQEAKNEVDLWLRKGYSTHYSQHNKQVEIKKGGPKQILFIVRTREKTQ